VEALDPRAGRFRIHNRNAFTSLSGLRGTWEGGDLGPLDAGPGESQDVALDVAGHERVTFRFLLREAAEWAPARHEVAWCQFEVERPQRAAPSRTGTVVSAPALPFVLDGPRLALWRAPTDNDGLPLVPDKSPGPLARWLELGLDSVPPDERDDVVHACAYRVLDDGAVLVEHVVTLGDELRDLPRVGVALVLQPGLERLEWFGRGPWENYSDRQASAVLGHYRSTVSDQYVPYIVPQEHGHHGDVRWLTLTDERGAGLKITGVPAIGFSASHFTAADLTAARHTTDLEPRAEVILHLDHSQRGLGTASCGPDTSPRYRLDAGVYRFAYVLQQLGL
jgi:beta-galactosidase